MAKYNKEGFELPDPTPVTLTVKQRQTVDKYQLIKAQILAAIAQDQQYEGEETFEESQDFEVEDDEMPMTPYERAELEVEDLRRTASYVREQEFVQEGKRRFTKAPPSLPAKPSSAIPGEQKAEEVSKNKG